MSDIRQTEGGDIEIENNTASLVGGADEVRQRIIQRLRTFRGEWFLDFSVGVPYYQDVLKKNPNPSTVAAVLQAAILGTLGVIELKEFSLDYDNARELIVDFKVLVFSGDIIQIIEGVGA